MRGSFKSEYSNQIHQLLITVSRHFYIKKDGRIAYQESPLSAHVKNLAEAQKEPLVYYIVRDHFSGNFILGLGSGQDLIPLIDFLYAAWRKKEEGGTLAGLPEILSVPKNIATPELLSGLKELGIKPVHPPSGFASGIAMIRSLEENVGFNLTRIAIPDFPGLLSMEDNISHYMLGGSFRKSKKQVWKEGLTGGHPRVPGNLKTFREIFPDPDPEEFSLPWKGEGQNPQIRVKGRSALPPMEGEVPSPQKLEKAQMIVEEAREKFFTSARCSRAYEALQVTPYCSDAYLYLANLSKSNEEKVTLFQRAVEACKAIWGAEYFQEIDRNFWHDVVSRNYMRGLLGLALCYYEQEKIGAAAAILEYLIKLDPEDNLGARYFLVNSLLYEGNAREAQAFLRKYDDDSSCMLYARVLLWLQLDDKVQARIALEEALEANMRVPYRLLRLHRVFFRSAGFYQYPEGSPEEAELCASISLPAWKNTPGAKDWLFRQVKKRNLQHIY